MFTLEYTKSHLLIYARKVFAKLDAVISLSSLPEEQRVALGQEMGHVNGMIHVLEQGEPTMIQMTMFYEFLRMFSLSVVVNSDAAYIEPASYMRFRLKNFDDISEFVQGNRGGDFLLMFLREVNAVDLDKRNIDQFCEYLISDMREYMQHPDLSSELECEIALRMIVIKNIQKIMKVEFDMFSKHEFHSYSIIIMETALDLLHVQGDLNIADFHHRTGELQLWLNEQVGGHEVELDQLPEDFCLYVTEFFKSVAAFAVTVASVVSLFIPNAQVAPAPAEEVAPEPDNGEQTVDIERSVESTMSQTYNNDGRVYPIGEDPHFGPGGFFDPDGSAGGMA
jgi:hypothetical protein